MTLILFFLSLIKNKMLFDDSFQNTRIICLNGAELNGDCISDSFFSLQFFMTFGLMAFFFVLVPILLIVFIVFCVIICRKNKEPLKNIIIIL